MPYTYQFPRPAVTVDCVVFGLDQGDLEVLLIRRGIEPFKDRWALPGGFVHMAESLDDAARRELAEETGARKVYLEQLYTFGDPGRDPRGRVVTVAYFALVRRADLVVAGGTDARAAAWFPARKPPPLAFDHGRVLSVAIARLKAKVRYEPIGFDLLPEKFTLGQLQRMYETILESPLDKRNFRKKVLGVGLVVPLDEVERGVPRRAARFHRFDRRTYAALERTGFSFAI